MELRNIPTDLSSMFREVIKLSYSSLKVLCWSSLSAPRASVKATVLSDEEECSCSGSKFRRRPRDNSIGGLGA
jgi:hypothetical protein